MAVDTKNAPVHHGTGFAVTSLVTGIVSLVLFFIPVFGFMLGAVAVVFGSISMRHPEGRGMAIAGLVTGSVTVLISMIILAFWLLAWTFAPPQPSYYY